MYNHIRKDQNDIFSSRTTFSQEKHMFTLGGSNSGESGLVLSTDAKPRLKWTSELHERFVQAVNQLGGSDKATPKTVMRAMGVPGLTLYHLKSHLQKYRLSKNLHTQANSGTPKSGYVLSEEKTVPETNGSFATKTSIMPQANKTMQINEAIQVQIEVQRRLHEQLQVQRQLQQRIEAQGKYLQSVLEKAQETMGKQHMGFAGLEAAKVQLSELVSKVSKECFSNEFSGVEEFPALQSLQVRPSQHADCSLDSCLTTSEGSQKEREMHDLKFEQVQPVWYGDLNEQKVFSSPIFRGAERTSCNIYSDSKIMQITNVKAEKEKESVSESPRKGRNEGILVEEAEHQHNSFRLEFPSTLLDLNSRDDSEVDIGCQQFDLNGYSWS